MYKVVISFEICKNIKCDPFNLNKLWVSRLVTKNIGSDVNFHAEFHTYRPFRKMYLLGCTLYLNPVFIMLI